MYLNQGILEMSILSSFLNFQGVTMIWHETNYSVIALAIIEEITQKAIWFSVAITMKTTPSPPDSFSFLSIFLSVFFQELNTLLPFS